MIDAATDECGYASAATGQVEVLVGGPEQQRRDGAYLQQKLGPHVGRWLQRQATEVSQEREQAWGVLCCRMLQVCVP